MIRALIRLLFLGVLVVLALAYFAPHYLEQAGNSLIKTFNNSAPIGLAQFIPSNVADKNSHLQVSVQGLDPNVKYEVTLDPVTCGGSPYKDLGSTTSDASGGVTEEFTFATLDTQQTWFVDIHKGTDPGGTIVECGQLVINQNSSSQLNTGTTLSTNGDSLSISLNPSSNDNAQQTSSTTDNESNEQTTTSTGSTPTTPKGFPNTGVNPGGKNSYDNSTYPRKF
jgi:hypothetical protein